MSSDPSKTNVIDLTANDDAIDYSKFTVDADGRVRPIEAQREPPKLVAPMPPRIFFRPVPVNANATMMTSSSMGAIPRPTAAPAPVPLSGEIAALVTKQKVVSAYQLGRACVDHITRPTLTEEEEDEIMDKAADESARLASKILADRKRERDEAKKEAEETAKAEPKVKNPKAKSKKPSDEAAEAAKKLAEETARKEAEEKAKEEARKEAEETARKEAEEKAKEESRMLAEETARKEAEETARKLAGEKAAKEAEEKAMEPPAPAPPGGALAFLSDDGDDFTLEGDGVVHDVGTREDVLGFMGYDSTDGISSMAFGMGTQPPDSTDTSAMDFADSVLALCPAGSGSSANPADAALAPTSTEDKTGADASSQKRERKPPARYLESDETQVRPKKQKKDAAAKASTDSKDTTDKTPADSKDTAAELPVKHTKSGRRSAPPSWMGDC